MRQLSVLLGLLLITTNISACSSDNDYIGDDVIPPHRQGQSGPKGEGILRLVTYNVLRFSYDDTKPLPGGNYATIAAMMHEIEADVVCINEVDRNTTRSGNTDQMNIFANTMDGWDYIFGKAIDYQGGDYGEGLATAKSILRKHTVPLPRGEGAEARVLVVAEMDDYIVCTTHLDHANPAAHTGQIDEINRFISENYNGSSKPVFLGGDLNARPDSESMAYFKEEWSIVSITQSTFPSNIPTSCIDYWLMYKNAAQAEIVQSQVYRQFKSGDVTTASDHLPVMIDVKLP